MSKEVFEDMEASSPRSLAADVNDEADRQGSRSFPV